MDDIQLLAVEADLWNYRSWPVVRVKMRSGWALTWDHS